MKNRDTGLNKIHEHIIEFTNYVENVDDEYLFEDETIIQIN
jgi:hypothetical protein